MERGSWSASALSGRGLTFLRAWTLLAIFVLLSSMLAWSAIAAKPVLAAGSPDESTIVVDTATQTVGQDVTVTVTAIAGGVQETTIDDTVFVSIDGFSTSVEASSSGPGEYQATVTDQTAEQVTVSATINGDPITTEEPTIDFTPGNPAKLNFLDSDQPAGGTADETFSTKVEITDSYGNRVTTASNTVELFTNPLTTLHGYAATPAENGVASFSGLAIYEAATGYTLNASSTGLSSDTSDSFDIAHGDPAKLVLVTDVQSTYTADQNIAPKVRIEDDHGNLVDDSTATVTLTFATNPSGGSLGDASTNASDGEATFAANVRKAGSGYSLNIGSTGLAGVTTGLFNVTHAAASKLVFSTQPENRTADDTFTVKVNVEDQYDNLVDDSTASVDLSLTGHTTSFVGTHPNDASGGIATFSGLQIHLAGTAYQFHATSAGLTGADSTAFNIKHGVPTHLVVTQDPNASYTADDDITVKVEVRDQYENLVNDGTGSNASVALTLNPNPTSAVLIGSPVGASGGVATFTLNVRKVGSGFGLDATSSGLTGDSSTGFNITPGKLDSFVVTTGPTTKIAGLAINVTATAYDHWGNVKTDYVGPATVTSTLSKSFGLNNGSSDDNPVQYVQFASAAWPSGQRTTTVKGFVAESGTISVGVTGATTYSGTATGTSPSFTIVSASPANVAFAVAPNDLEFPFDFTPITTKTGTAIYHVCAPSGGSAPCATTTGGTPSTALKVLVRDQYGNRVSGATVQVKVDGAGTAYAPSLAGTGNGIYAFGDAVIAPTGTTAIGQHTLVATAGAATSSPSPAFTVVNDLEACDNQACDNNADNGKSNLQKVGGRITTSNTNDFFVPGGNNVRLSTQFVPGSDVTNQCASNKTIGDATDLLITGQGAAGTTPNTVMVFVVTKNTLKSLGITSRGTDSFNLCLGALNLTGGSVRWKGKDPAGKKSGLFDSVPRTAGGVTREWGVPANCGTANLPANDPCVGLRTKQVATLRSYLTGLGWTTAEINGLGMNDADFAIVLKKGAPWDGKGGLF